MAMAAELHGLSKIATNPENSVADDDNLYEYDMSSKLYKDLACGKVTNATTKAHCCLIQGLISSHAEKSVAAFLPLSPGNSGV
jgi:hypothetical protein